MLQSVPQAAPDTGLHGAERCVACGLCLPHCPTYRLTQDEAESPRGRIALMRALARNELPLSERLETHLAHCLVCRACEKVCPSYVPYGQLMNATQAEIEARHPTSGIEWRLHKLLLNRLIVNADNLQRLGKLLYWYQRSGLQRLARASGLLKLFAIAKTEAFLPTLTPPMRLGIRYSARRDRKGTVALFTGCVARITDNEIHAAAIRLLNILGYDVHIPPQQTCCGALHLRTGEAEKAQALMRRNLEAFAADNETVLTTASGCGATLQEYNRHLGHEAASAFAGRVTDISDFLAHVDWRGIALRPLSQRVAVHDSCTLTNVLRQNQAPYALLRKIPGLEISPLPENPICCGGAGTYPLTQPGMARQLRDDKVRLLKTTSPDIVATSNTGCALQLAAGLREARLHTEVLHPVVLLARQLPD